MRRGSRRGERLCDRPTSNTRGPDHRTRRSRRGGCSGGRFSGEAACPRRRSGAAFRLDTRVKPWHKRDDRLGSRRSIEAVTRGSGGPSSRPSPQPPRPSAYASLLRSLNEEAVDAAAAMDAENAPTAAWKSRTEREIPTAPTAILFFFRRTKTKTAYDDHCADLRGFR